MIRNQIISPRFYLTEFCDPRATLNIQHNVARFSILDLAPVRTGGT